MEDEIETLTNMTLQEHRFIKNLKLKNEKEFVRNPYSGRGMYLTPLQVAIYDYIKGCEALGSHSKNKTIAIGMFQKYWPKEYMTLLD